jgi:hypothetical protein
MPNIAKATDHDDRTDIELPPLTDISSFAPLWSTTP